MAAHQSLHTASVGYCYLPRLRRQHLLLHDQLARGVCRPAVRNKVALDPSLQAPLPDGLVQRGAVGRSGHDEAVERAVLVVAQQRARLAAAAAGRRRVQGQLDLDLR